MSQDMPHELKTLSLELLSDTTIGRGEGTAGQVDVEVDHDQWGIPLVNGKTIRSLLRDTWLTMQLQFPELQAAGLRVFGPHAELRETGILRIGRASIGTLERQWLQAAVERATAPISPATILAGLTDIRSQTSEDRTTAAPERTTLRSMRVLVRGLVLVADLDWLETPSADDVRCAALALLGTRHLGLARNRGRGYVRFGFGGDDSAARTRDYATGAESFRPNPTTAAAQSRPVHTTAVTGGTLAGSDVWYVPYSLTLKSPAILTSLIHDPNTVSTLRYIPGSMLRGAVARAIGNPQRDAATRIEFHALVLGGNVAWLNAYPVCGKDRTLPAPPGLRRDKQQSQGEERWDTFDLSAYDGRPDETHELEIDDDRLHWPENSLAGLGESFVTFGGTAYRLSPQVSGRVHQQRDRMKGRAWTEPAAGNEQPHGTVFATESLDAGQTFSGAIQIRAATVPDRDRIVDRIESLLGDAVLLGRSRRAEYGGQAEVALDRGQLRRREWAQLPGRLTSLSAGQWFRILLTSPCIVRDPDTGQMDPAALKNVIERELGDRAQVKWLRTGFETVGGFNRKWRLELPQTLAVATGSVVVLEATNAISGTEIESLEDTGLGERQAEGFGRFLFVQHDEAGRGALRPPAKEQPRPAPTASPPPLIVQLQQRIVWTALEREIDGAASDIAREAHPRPSNSLIGRLRELLRDQSTEVACKHTVRQLRSWLDDPDEKKRLKKPAMDKLDRCRVGRTANAGRGRQQSLTSWLLDVLKSQSPRDLNLDAIAGRCRLIAASPADAAAEDPVRAILQEQRNWLKVRLIDSVLDLMALRNRQREGGRR